MALPSHTHYAPQGCRKEANAHRNKNSLAEKRWRQPAGMCERRTKYSEELKISASISNIQQVPVMS